MKLFKAQFYKYLNKNLTNPWSQVAEFRENLSQIAWLTGQGPPNQSRIHCKHITQVEKEAAVHSDPGQ